MKQRKSQRTRVNEMMELQKTLREERKKSSDFLNRLKYLQADFENYRKRMGKEIQETAKISKEKLIINLLNVMDELELALISGRKTKNKQALLNGVEMTLKKMCSTLEQEGLTKIKAVGQSFDPNLHEVIMKIPTKEYKENMIIEEIRKGYLLKDKVIRPSAVKITTKFGDSDE